MWRKDTTFVYVPFSPKPINLEYVFLTDWMDSAPSPDTNYRSSIRKNITVKTLIRSVLYRLVHFFLELFLNTDALSKKIEIICYGSQIFLWFFLNFIRNSINCHFNCLTWAFMKQNLVTACTKRYNTKPVS